MWTLVTLVLKLSSFSNPDYVPIVETTVPFDIKSECEDGLKGLYTDLKKEDDDDPDVRFRILDLQTDRKNNLVLKMENGRKFPSGSYVIMYCTKLGK